ncbi:hypothetical protein Z949_609 [Sulfitobacter guttiformis KCTC 32187]|nr:hypothetical protein Z949_609 [Sulfitobacter guttiformis KCTC 32187]
MFQAKTVGRTNLNSLCCALRSRHSVCPQLDAWQKAASIAADGF